MKPKIDLDAIAALAYTEYEQRFKKEVERAQKEGRTDCVILSDFKFACGTTATLMVFGEFSGKVQKFYKQMKRQRGAEKDFAMGSVYFEPKNDGTTTLHVALEDGKARPNDIKRNGKKAFTKIGFDINIYKGEPRADLELTEEEETAVEQEAADISKEDNVRQICKNYQKAIQLVSNQVLPKTANKSFDKQDFEAVKQLYTLSKALQQELETVDATTRSKYETQRSAAEKHEAQSAKLLVAIKQNIMANNNGGDKNITMNEALNAFSKTVPQCQTLAEDVKKLIEAEKALPLERTTLKESITLFEQKINEVNTWLASNETQLAQDKNYPTYRTQYQSVVTLLPDFKANLETFEKQRAQESASLEALAEKWTVIEPLQSHILEHLKGRESSKIIYNFEAKLLTELQETIQLWFSDFALLTERAKKQCQSDLTRANALKSQVSGMQSAYKVSPHPSGKDKLFDSYINIDQSQPLAVIAKSIEKIDQWLEEQKTVAESFSKPVSLDVPHLVQQGPTDCKLTCQKMLEAYLSKKGMSAKEYGISDFGNKANYISIVKEDKSKAAEIVEVEGKRYESLENEALIQQDSSQEGYQYIFDQLDLGAPLVVGVDHTYNRVLSGAKGSVKSETGGYNSDKTTDHFIVIYGKGMENGVPYLMYLDPGTSKGGKTTDNRLYPLWQNENLCWYDPNSAMKGKTYTLSAVCKFKKDLK